MQRYTPPKPAPLPADFQEFYDQLTPQEKQLHQLAIEKLGSSYFPQWTHMYTKWQRAQPEKKTKSLAEEKPKLE
jgi:hypothetical protein